MKKMFLIFLTLSILILVICLSTEDQKTENTLSSVVAIKSSPVTPKKIVTIKAKKLVKKDDFDHLSNTLNLKEKKEILNAAAQLFDPLAKNKNKALNFLFNHGDRSLYFFIEELKRENYLANKREAKQRMLIIDVLGVAAESKPFVLDALKKYIETPVNSSKDKALIKMDRADRLEVFEYVVRSDREYAVAFIHKLSNLKAKKQYVNSFVVGLKRLGINSSEAVNIAFKLFRNLS